MKKLDKDFIRVDEEKSGICHHMIFEKKYLDEIFSKIEKNHNDTFYNVFLKLSAGGNPNGASEYEIYFNYILKYHPTKIKIRKLNWQNKNYTSNKNNTLHYVSAHHYLRK